MKLRSFISILCAAVLLAVSLPTAVATAAVISSGFKYTVENNEATITWDYSDADVLIIPQELDGYPVTTIGKQAFFCNYHTSVTIPGCVKTLGEQSFASSYVLTYLDIQNGVEVIGKSAFSGCALLTQVTIPDSVHTIADRAFAYSDRLQSVSLGAGVTALSPQAFYHSKALKAVDVSEDNPAFCDVDGVVFSKDMTTLVYYPADKEGETYRIPDSVKIIGSYAFSDNQHLKTMILSDNVETIGDYAFCDTDLSAVSLGRVKSIGEYAFSSTALTEVTIPDSVEAIGDSAFSSSHEMKHASIGAGLKTLGVAVFNYNSSMVSIDVSEQNTAFTAVDGVLFSKDKATLICSPSHRPTTRYAIPDGVQAIEPNAFVLNTLLLEISVPGSVKTIGNNAFSDCYNLKYVTLAPGVETIGNNAFMNCMALEEIHIPDSVHSLGGAFWRCEKLKSVYIPDGITSIESFTFYGCMSLTSITIPRSVTSIGFCAFEDCEKLKTVIYYGSAQDRAAIAVDQGNLRLENAAWECRYGDLNDDGTLNTLDALRLYVAVSGTAVPDETLLDRADLNDDGMVNMADALLLFRTASGY